MHSIHRRSMALDPGLAMQGLAETVLAFDRWSLAPILTLRRR